MNNRDRFKATLNFERPDRMPKVEWATWWTETLARWHKEGLPENLNGIELQEYFGLDPMVQIWFNAFSPKFSAPAEGRNIVETEQDYLDLIDRKLIYQDESIDFSMFEKYRSKHEQGEYIYWFTLPGFFWSPRTLFGIENHLYAFYDHPELMKKMNSDHLDYYLRILEKMFAAGYQPEFMTFAEDLSYNHGPMLSREQFMEFVAPYYQDLVKLLKKHGVKVFIDTDGDVAECIEWFIEVGIEGILPLERRAGVDVAALRKKYPDFLFIGAYDKTVMDCGDAAMREEFERLLPVIRQGGFVASCDHQTPPLVSLEEYFRYCGLLSEYAGMI